jgi:hypothetical protein
MRGVVLVSWFQVTLEKGVVTVRGAYGFPGQLVNTYRVHGSSNAHNKAFCPTHGAD